MDLEFRRALALMRTSHTIEDAEQHGGRGVVFYCLETQRWHHASSRWLRAVLVDGRAGEWECSDGHENYRLAADALQAGGCGAGRPVPQCLREDTREIDWARG